MTPVEYLNKHTPGWIIRYHGDNWWSGTAGGYGTTSQTDTQLLEDLAKANGWGWKLEPESEFKWHASNLKYYQECEWNGFRLVASEYRQNFLNAHALVSKNNYNLLRMSMDDWQSLDQAKAWCEAEARRLVEKLEQQKHPTQFVAPVREGQLVALDNGKPVATDTEAFRRAIAAALHFAPDATDAQLLSTVAKLWSEPDKLAADIKVRLQEESARHRDTASKLEAALEEIRGLKLMLKARSSHG